MNTPLYRLLFYFLTFAATLQSCKSGCDIDCSCYPTLLTAGFQDNEFDTIVLKSYKPGGNFQTLVNTHIFTKTGVQPKWPHQNNDSTNDTLGISWILEYILSDNANRHSPILDLEIAIPSEGVTHRFSAITFSGPETNKVKCYHGSAQPGQDCSSKQYLSSYVLDSTKILFPSNNSYIYFTK
jgi:hypothetical protein